MALLKFIGLFMFSHGGNQNQQGGCITLMCVAICSTFIGILPYRLELKCSHDHSVVKV